MRRFAIAAVLVLSIGSGGCAVRYYQEPQSGPLAFVYAYPMNPQDKFDPSVYKSATKTGCGDSELFPLKSWVAVPANRPITFSHAYIFGLYGICNINGAVTLQEGDRVELFFAGRVQFPGLYCSMSARKISPEGLSTPLPLEKSCAR